jgi:hypothetical protein
MMQIIVVQSGHYVKVSNGYSHYYDRHTYARALSLTLYMYVCATAKIQA